MTGSTRDPRTDAELLLAVADGDRVAFEDLHRRHFAWLAIRLGNRCADRTVVDDVLQDTFLAVWHGTARFRSVDDADIGAWLWRVASHKMVDAMRRDSAHRRRLDLLRWRRPVDEPSAEDLALRGVEHGDLAGSLGRLAPELRAVIQATVLDGFSTKEAAVLLGIPEGTVKTRAKRARARLREELA